MLCLVIFFVLILLFIVLFLKLSFSIRYKKEKDYSCISIKIYVFKKIRIAFFSKKIPGLKDDKKNKFLKIYENVRKIIKKDTFYRKELLHIKKLLKSKIGVEKLSLKIVIGTNNACYTGILTGLLWSSIGIIVSFFNAKNFLNKDSFIIISDFENKIFLIDFSCIIKMKIVHIIVIGFKILSYKIAYKRKRKK